MDKIIEALSSLLPDDQIKEVKEAVEAYLEEAKADLEAEYTEKLEEAYVELHGELQKNEETAIKGYEEAYTVIQDLRNRLELQRQEYEQAIDEGYEEAYQMLVAERGKNESIELDVYEAAEGKLEEMKKYMVDRVHDFLEYKGQELYEQARRDVMNDPRMVEHKVALDRIVEQVQDYIDDEDYQRATSSKLEDQSKLIDDLKGKLRIIEARNVRLDVEKKKLEEQVRHASQLITEATQKEKKDRIEAAKNVQGRGRQQTKNVEVLQEYNEEPQESDGEDVDTTLAEAFDPDQLRTMQVLAGTREND